MNDYVVSCTYGALKGCRFFFNDHIFFDTAGAIASHMNFIVSPFLRAGENAVNVSGGSMALTPELDGKEIPDVDIALRRIEFFGDKRNIIEKFSLLQEEDASCVEEVDGIQTVTFTFKNSSEYDFSKRFETFSVCNKDETHFEDYHKRMKEFAEKMYRALYNEDIDSIVDKSSIKLEDDSLRGYGDKEIVTSLYKKELSVISSLQPKINLTNPEQFIFAPSCGGRIWRIGIMPSSQLALAMQNAISMLPAALPRFESELFCTTWQEKESAFLPSYLAFVDNECCIVR